jgi:hypothetical protein
MLKRKTKKRIVRGKKRKNGGAAAAAYEPLEAASSDSEAYKKKFTMENLEEDFKPGVTTQSNDLKPLVRYLKLLLTLAKKPKVPYPRRMVDRFDQDDAEKTHREYNSSMTFKELTDYLHRKSINPGPDDYYVTSNPIVELDQDETQTVDDGECQVLSGLSCEDVEKIKKEMPTGLTFRLLCIIGKYRDAMFFIFEDILRGDNYRRRRRVFIRITNTETFKRIERACMSRFEHVRERLHVESPPFMSKVKDVFTSLKTSMRKPKPNPTHKTKHEGGGMKKSRKSRKYRR